MSLVTFPRQFLVDANGTPRVGAKANFYASGTATPITTYTTGAYAVPHANPVLSVAGGLFPAVYINPAVNATYKIVITDSADVPLYENDNIPAMGFTADDITAVLEADADSRELLGQITNPLSAAESAGSVTPVAYAERYEDPSRQGALGNDVADDTAAIQAAVNASRYGNGRVHFRNLNRNGRTIYRAAGIVVYENTHFTADAGVLIRKIGGGASTTHIFDGISTFGTTTALTANTAKRDATVLVTSAVALSVGQLVWIRDTQYKFTTNGRNMEFNEISAISGLTITLKNRLIGAYLTASAAELVPATLPVRNVTFENIHCEIPSGQDGGAFYFQEAYDCTLINCSSKGQKGQAGVQTWRAAYIKVIGGDYSDGQDQSTPGYGYGIAFAQSSHNCVARGVTTRNVRENAISIGSKFCKFIDCDARSTYDNSFNTHADGNEDCEFINCRSHFARSKGFYAGGVTAQAADKRIRFIGCESHYAGYLGFWADGASGVESEDIQFINCKDFHPGDDTATSFSFYTFRSIRPRVINCFSDADGEANVRACIKAEICTDAVIRGNTVRGATSGWGIIHANCTGVTIDDNTIGNIGSSQGVHAESTASTKVYVRRNKVDNDITFTQNAGDINEYNEYNTKRDRVSGATSVADGGTITHGMVTTPVWVHASVTTSGEFASVTAKGGTTFTVALKKHDNTAGTTQIVYWEAGL